MRVIVHGVGAIGGTIAGELARAGVEVVGIARGAMLEAIRARGLTVHAPEESFTQGFEVVGSSAADLARTMAGETARWKSVIEGANITVD